MADYIAALHVVILFCALMGDVAQEYHGIARLGMQDDVLLIPAPFFKLLVLDTRIQMGRFRKMPPFDEFEMPLARDVILKIERGIHAARLNG